MATRGGATECHILRIPYEILKEILLLLPQKDLLLRVSPTCTRLWQVAYPMAYRQIIVIVGPARSNSAWRQLASGYHNGAPFIQKLEIRSLYKDNETPRREEDVVMYSIVAALFKNQLSSFRLTTPNARRRTVFIRNVHVLHKTQQSLFDLELPGIHNPNNRSPQSHLNDEMYIEKIALNSICLQQIHLRVSGPINHNVNFTLRDDWLNLGTIQFAIPFVTRLAFFNMDMYIAWDSISFPQTQSLSFIDCLLVGNFLSSPDGLKFPSVKAFMVKQKSAYLPGLSGFLKQLKPLRELILDCGITLTDDDISSITQNGESLEILAIGNSHHLDGLKILSVLEECHALQHLSIGAYNAFVSPDGTRDLPDDAFRQSISLIAKLGHIWTLGVRFSQFLRWNRDRSSFSVGDLRKLLRSTFCDELIIGNILDILKGSRGVDVDFEPLKCVRTTSKLLLLGLDIDPGHESLMEEWKPLEKRIMALEEEIVLKQVQEVKRDIVAQFSASQHYFMEDYINCIMTQNSLKIL